jgi:hypothetical protein
MKIKEKAKNFLTKLQNLPDHQKKVILWTAVAVLAAILGYFWVMGALNSLDKIGKNVGQIKFPEIQMPENIKNADLFVQDQQVTEGWKTYTNTKYEFEIKYPSDWAFREYDTGTGAAFFPQNKLSENTTGNGSINVGFYKKGSNYCKIPFDDYVKTAGPSEIQNYESINTINGGTTDNGVKAYKITWNYTDFQGTGKISLPITYFETEQELCGNVEAFLNDNNYSDIYNNIISTFGYKQDISSQLTKMSVNDSLLTKDKELCSPFSDDKTPYCGELGVLDSATHEEKYSEEKYDFIQKMKCPPDFVDTPKEIIIYNTLDNATPPSGKSRIAFYCAPQDQFWISEYNSEKVPMGYWYGPFEGYPIPPK